MKKIFRNISLLIAIGIVTTVCISCEKENDDKHIVYVAGYQINENGVYIAMLWKNGAAQNLTDGTTNAIAFSVFVSGKDVYVAGYEGAMAKLWKNGIAQNLTDGTTCSATAYSVYVSGKNVYVAGWTS